jgi:hypothetical protein
VKKSTESHGTHFPRYLKCILRPRESLSGPNRQDFSRVCCSALIPEANDMAGRHRADTGQRQVPQVKTPPPAKRVSARSPGCTGLYAL